MSQEAKRLDEAKRRAVGRAAARRRGRAAEAAEAAEVAHDARPRARRARRDRDRDLGAEAEPRARSEERPPRPRRHEAREAPAGARWWERPPSKPTVSAAARVLPQQARAWAAAAAAQLEAAEAAEAEVEAAQRVSGLEPEGLPQCVPPPPPPPLASSAEASVTVTALERWLLAHGVSARAAEVGRVQSDGEAEARLGAEAAWRDGLELLALVEALERRRLEGVHRAPRAAAHCLRNVEKAMEALRTSTLRKVPHTHLHAAKQFVRGERGAILRLLGHLFAAHGPGTRTARAA